MTCYHHLTRANKIVKKKLLTAIEEINANGTSNWDDAFKVAFKTFETSRAINQTTGCEKAIVIFTDETGQPVDVSFNHPKNKFDKSHMTRMFQVFCFDTEFNFFKELGNCIYTSLAVSLKQI